jgi:hypothetical protein
MLTAPEPKRFNLQVIGPTDGTGAAKGTNENFGTFSFQRQLSGKPPLARICLHVVSGRNAQ